MASNKGTLNNGRSSLFPSSASGGDWSNMTPDSHEDILQDLTPSQQGRIKITYRDCDDVFGPSDSDASAPVKIPTLPPHVPSRETSERDSHQSPTTSRFGNADESDYDLAGNYMGPPQPPSSAMQQTPRATLPVLEAFEIWRLAKRHGLDPAFILSAGGPWNISSNGREEGNFEELKAFGEFLTRQLRYNSNAPWFLSLTFDEAERKKLEEVLWV